MRASGHAGLRALLLALLIGAGLATDWGLDRFDAGDRAAQQASGSSLRTFLASLSYEIRGLCSRLLYLKIDRYVHEGEKIDFGDGAVGFTMIENREIVPLYGLITYLDPHFIEAFSLGGNHLIHGLGKPEEGRRLLRFGIDQNRDNSLAAELMGQLGVHLARDLNRTEEAIPLFEEALALRRRPDAASLPQGFVFTADQLVGILAVSCWRVGRLDQARAWLAQPNHLPLDHPVWRASGVPPAVHQESPGASGEHDENHHPGEEGGHSPMDHTGEGAGTEEAAFDPRWWRRGDRRSALHRRTAIASMMAIVLICWPLALAASRRKREE